MLTFYIQNINVEVTENPKDNKNVFVLCEWKHMKLGLSADRDRSNLGEIYKTSNIRMLI